MNTGQAQPVPMHCPRCGGLMYKPENSPFYWHATNNHPRCTITNISVVEKSASADNLPSTITADHAEKEHS